MHDEESPWRHHLQESSKGQPDAGPVWLEVQRLGTSDFKFEKGSVKPSLTLWLKLAENAGLSQRRAVLLHVKSKLPEKFQDFIEMQDEKAANAEANKVKKKGAKPDYSKFESREQMRSVLDKDKNPA